MKRLLSLLLCVLLIAALAACTPGGSTAAVSGAASASSAVVSETPAPFTFRRKVCSSFLEKTFGKKMVDAWFALVDAVYEGETEFACPDDETCRWVVGQFATRCHPAIEGMLTTPMSDPDHPVKNGMGRFSYTVTDEERVARLTEFEATVEKHLNAAMTSDMTDFEKALCLYRYYAENFVYDYDSYYKMSEAAQDQLVPYRTLTEKTGVCQDLSFSYSYLLMQAGVDAGVASGDYLPTGEGHQWSMVKLNGKYYHIDPTFALGSPDDLTFFLMSDEQREETGFERPFAYVSVYTNDHPVAGLDADDDTFRPLWNADLTNWDRKNKTLTVVGRSHGDEVTATFSYKGY